MGDLAETKGLGGLRCGRDRDDVAAPEPANTSMLTDRSLELDQDRDAWFLRAGCRGLFAFSS